MPGNEALAAAIAATRGDDVGRLEMRRFPDGETYVRLLDGVAERDVVIVCTLARPDPQLAGLVFAAGTARELGAASVHLVAPYLAYMRQDARFQPGEAISSVHFARLLSGAFDSLLTVDPHLHRRRSLDEIFAIPTQVVAAAPALSRWIAAHVPDALVVGPDGESEQWAAAVASGAGAPHVVLSKRRLGDRQVEIALPDLSAVAGRTPVLVDDIVSSGRTMAEAARLLIQAGFARPVCVAVHAIFAEDALERLAGLAAHIVTTDTIPHPTNAIGVADLIAGVRPPRGV
jgi:ribose-phosphate pyrophosphokinase